MLCSSTTAAVLAAESGGDGAWAWIVAFAIVGVLMWVKGAPARERQRAYARQQMKHRAETDRELGATSGSVARYISGTYVDKVATAFNYLGGNPSHPNAVPGVGLVLAKDRFGVERHDGTLLFSIRHEDLVSIEVETEQEIQERVTAKRLILTGVLAFAWTKRSGGSVLVAISTRGSGDFVIEATGLTKPQVLAMLAPVIAATDGTAADGTATDGTAADGTATDGTAAGAGRSSDSGDEPDRPRELGVIGRGPADIEERLARIEDLHERGVITESEYLELRKRILDDL